MRADHDAVGKMKQFATYFTHGVRHGAQLRSSIYTVNSSAANPHGFIWSRIFCGTRG